MVDVYLNPQSIAQRLQELALELNQHYSQQPLHVVCVLGGSLIFTADLIRLLHMPVTLDFIKVSSYENGTVSSGQITLQQPLQFNIAQQQVLIVEDIVDTGITLEGLRQHLQTQQPASLACVALLSKPARRQTNVQVEWIGFSIPDVFVVGYGLDYAQQYRNLPYVGVLQSEQDLTPNT